MIVWGGLGVSSYLSDGGVYDPATDTWSALPANGLEARMGHTTVWTGDAMIVWGGLGSSGAMADGALFEP
jgi:hypothetical protein